MKNKYFRHTGRIHKLTATERLLNKGKNRHEMTNEQCNFSLLFTMNVL